MNGKLSRWFSDHWLLVVNTFFLVYATLPLAAPILLANGYAGPASLIYRAYGLTCHQLPSHSYFIAGHQVAICQRCLAVYMTMALAGLVYGLSLFRWPVISFKWVLLFVIPIAVDGGLGFVSQLSLFVPLVVFWLLGLTAATLLSVLLYRRQAMTWQAILFMAAGPFTLLYLQFFGSHESNWWLRTITGAIYAIGVVWFFYPALALGFRSTSPSSPSPSEISPESHL